MAHIVYLTTGLTSYLHASYGLARRLQRRGHRVTYLSTADLADRVAAQGHAFEPLAWTARLKDVPTHARFKALRLRQRLLHPGAARRRRAALLSEWGDTSAFLAQLERLQPDLLLADVEMQAHLIAAYPLGRPMLQLCIWFTPFRHPGLPPLHHNARPQRGWLDRPLAALRWSGYLVKKTMRRELLRVRRLGTDPASRLRWLAKQQGYPVSGLATSHWLDPLLLTNIPVMMAVLQALDFPHAPHPMAHFVGPLIDLERAEPEASTGAAALLAQLRRDRAAGRRVIYASLGSFVQHDGAFLRRVIQACSTRPDWVLVLGLGRTMTPEALGPLPDHVHAMPWVPQLAVLGLADAVLTHGGIATINECIHFEVPMVVYSTARVDQNGCAERLVFHGLARQGSLHQDTPAQIAAHLDAVLTDGEMPHRLAQMNREMQAARASAAAERLLESLLHDRHADTR